MNTNLLKEAIFGKQRNTNLYNRRLLLRGFTNIKQQKEITKITGSKRKANVILVNFIEYFWNCFYERLWKFRCEVMVEWEKKNNILGKDKKKKQKRKKAKTNKENVKPKDRVKETRKEKEMTIQEEASKKIDKWVNYGVKERWSKFKTK